MKEYICLKCYTVFISGVASCRCGGEVEEFSAAKHGRFLIGSSNSWFEVWERWGDHPMLKKVSDELSDMGSWGSATHLNEFISRLIESVNHEKT